MKMNADFLDFLKESELDCYIETEEDFDLLLYHDLGVYGDVAWSYIDMLSDSYGVDTAQFQFELYFPSEFYQGNWVLSNLAAIFPFIRKNMDMHKGYRKFPISKFENAIAHGVLK